MHVKTFRYGKLMNSIHSLGSTTKRIVNSNVLKKNAFCAICNPEVTQDILPVSSCFFTEGHSMYDELNVIGCGFFPQIEFYSPFKNLFCKLCNTTFPKYECATGGFYIPHTFGSRSLAWYPIYRNLFVYSDHDEVLSENASPKCKSTQAYISKLVSFYSLVHISYMISLLLIVIRECTCT